MATLPHTSFQAFIKRHPVLTYYVLTFAISWGGFLLVGGPGLFSGTSWQSDPLFMFAILVMVVGPSIASILLTGFVDGRRAIAACSPGCFGGGWALTGTRSRS